tara:strand:+ start:451 stop:768 length:318 start_codon:yes stop_codon:yes gene_type:complete
MSDSPKVIFEFEIHEINLLLRMSNRQVSSLKLKLPSIQFSMIACVVDLVVLMSRDASHKKLCKFSNSKIFLELVSQREFKEKFSILVFLLLKEVSELMMCKLGLY